MTIPTFLPGTFTLMPGTSEDYRALESFHYLHKRPRTWAAVWVVAYGSMGVGYAQVVPIPARSQAHSHPGALPIPRGTGGRGDRNDAVVISKCRRRRAKATVLPVGSRLVAVGVLSWPTAVNRGRDRVFGLTGKTFGEKIHFANANLRTISRVIVHPQFRSLGLATALVRCLCDHCPTRYVEASAQMGRAVPMFERAGMKRLDPEDRDRPLYYVLDKGKQS